ncbi:MAG: hypothetical protein LAT66_05965 [Alkalimonas sp.]|nr:hypothetical protein [Alkalimonas sp.]
MRIVLLLVLAAWLAGCSQLPFCAHCQQVAEVETPAEPMDEPWYRVPAQTPHDVSTSPKELSLPAWPQSQKRLQHYAEQLAYQLTLSEQLAGQRIVISSFVDLDEGLNQSNPLGNQLSEILRTVLPQYGLVVIEHKLTNALWVGPQGDFALSRDARMLARQLSMDAILTGTMIATDRGMEIHARVVEVDTQQISSSASGFIPHTVLNQIRP